MEFWIVVSISIALVIIALGLVLFLKRDDGLRSGAELDMEVYRDQLKTVEIDLQRNVLSKQEAARVKVEISRRILDADKAMKSAKESQIVPVYATVSAVVGVAIALAGSVALYKKMGVPGFADQPLKSRIEMANEERKNRPSQSEIESGLPPSLPQVDSQSLDLIKKLRDAVAKNPDDLVGQQYLAQYESSIGEYQNAYKAQIRIVEIKKQDATADDYAMLANLMAMAAGGYVSPEAETVLKRALDKDPKNGVALYLTGKMFSQTGRTDVTFNIWQNLLAQSTPDDPWYAPIRAQIMQAAQIAGVNYELPEEPTSPALAGPSADDVAAASEMTQSERQGFITSMVNRLTERLTTEGGSPKEWAQLIGALGVQGNTDKAREMIAMATETYAGDAAAIATINAAAKRAGVSD